MFLKIVCKKSCYVNTIPIKLYNYNIIFFIFVSISVGSFELRQNGNETKTIGFKNNKTTRFGSKLEFLSCAKMFAWYPKILGKWVWQFDNVFVIALKSDLNESLKKFQSVKRA